MAHYLALVEVGGTAFGVVIPDCPGCTAMALTFDEAIQNAVEALREWMADRVSDGFEPPVSSSIAALRNDPSLAEDFATDPVVVGVPLLLDAGRPVRANISLDAGLLAQIVEEARLRGLTRPGFIASAARDKIAARR